MENDERRVAATLGAAFHDLVDARKHQDLAG
ncbi:hypothetical protein ACVMIX_005170 [Rhizobium leguminosarum]|jgi:hypothetical protein|uniref:Uncharacterized protein n=1 Tax=Rhizobium leguminosarum TaxID=384 RepID=A0A2Z4YSA6_RHILE|nr:hypothetical protein DLJ82_7253 [Rhizobium leguminosarum]MBA9036454.1 hypothetical protein [Rhizobium leguminosarum]